MPDQSNNPFKFWQELKRRKVIRVIPVYAAAAFVLLELVDILTEPLRLPDWTINLVLVLLCVGFVISIIFSWLYDITPEGVQKTKPIKEIQKEVKPTNSNVWKITTYVSLAIIIGLLVVNIFGSRRQTEVDTVLEKSIAVRPFKSLSDDPEKQYLADGVMDAILLHLSKIKDLRVMSRTSVEQYRETNKTATVIGRELDAMYLLEGSFQKYGEKARLIVQLIKTSDDSHVWSNEYDRDWKDIFSVQSEVAMTIACELKVIITPQEKQIIEKAPTTNLTAYDFYLRALEEHNNYRENWTENQGKANVLDKAILLYQLTLEYDSSYAKAYTGLAMAYRDKHYQETYFEDDFLDSTLILANIALSYDSKLEEAYEIRGDYYLDHGKYEEALQEYDAVIEFNPNYWRAYTSKASLYSWTRDFLKVIENYQKAIKLNRGKELPRLLRTLGSSFVQLKMYNRAEFYLEEALKLDHDSVKHNNELESWERMHDYERGKIIFTEVIEKAKEMHDTLWGGMLYQIAYANSVLGHHKEAYRYWSKYAEDIKESEGIGISVSHRIGYAYWQAGYKEEAKKYFDDHLYHCKESIKLNRPYSNRLGAFYDLAGYYAFFGDKEKAYQYLDEFLNNLNFFGPSWFRWIIFDPLFNGIRDEEKFQNIIHEMEIKDQKEIERVRAWLEENELVL